MNRQDQAVLTIPTFICLRFRPRLVRTVPYLRLYAWVSGHLLCVPYHTYLDMLGFLATVVTWSPVDAREQARTQRQDQEHPGQVQRKVRHRWPPLFPSCVPHFRLYEVVSIRMGVLPYK